MNPILLKLAHKILVSDTGKKMLKKALSNSEKRFNRIAQSLLPSEHHYLKGRDVSSTSLPLSGLYSLLHSTNFKADIERLKGCGNEVNKVIPFESENTVLENLERLSETLGRPLPEALRRAAELQPLIDAIPSDAREGLAVVNSRILENPNTQNLASILNQKFSSSIMHSITDRKESSLTDEEMLAMQLGSESFNKKKDVPLYQRGIDSLGPRPKYEE